MARLYDIKGYWSEDETKEFSEEKMWQGQLELEDDGWFTGIVYEEGKPYNGARFIFGAYFPGIGMELLLFSAPEVCPPLAYRAIKEEQDYEGFVSVLDTEGDHAVGYSQIKTCESKKQDPNYKVNMYDWHLNFMLYVDLRNLYEEIFSTRSQFLETIKNKYQNTFRNNEPEAKLTKNLKLDE